MAVHYIPPLYNAPSWVKFDLKRLLNLQKNGYEYFVFVVKDGFRKLYPFKTYNEALDKKRENSHLDIQDNYIMCDDYALTEIAKGTTMRDVMVQFKIDDNL